MSKNRDAHDDVIFTWYDHESDRLHLERNGVREEVPPITRDYIRDLNDLMNALRSRCDDAILSNGGWMKRYAKLMRKNAETQQQLNDAMESMGRVEERCAKLRELVRELWTYAEQDLLCDENCSYGAVCDWRDCVFKRRMRETGIEVDE